MTTASQYIVEILLGDREAIRAAAIRFPDGTVYEASFHAECWYEAYSMGKIKEDPSQGEFIGLIDKYHVEEGFTTTRNRFVNRSEAFDISVASGQRPPETSQSGEGNTEFLDSNDIADRYRT
ncbi:MAG: hypothetical protein ACOYB3_01055 [Azonexus sp.]|jgi:hypothetical protein